MGIQAYCGLNNGIQAYWWSMQWVYKHIDGLCNGYTSILVVYAMGIQAYWWSMQWVHKHIVV